jgi:hypothetical protein
LRLVEATWKNSQADPRGFLRVHVLKHRVSGFVEELQFISLGKHFNFTHGQKLTLPRGTGKQDARHKSSKLKNPATA